MVPRMSSRSSRPRSRGSRANLRMRGPSAAGSATVGARRVKSREALEIIMSLQRLPDAPRDFERYRSRGSVALLQVAPGLFDVALGTRCQMRQQQAQPGAAGQAHLARAAPGARGGQVARLDHAGKTGRIRAVDQALQVEVALLAERVL